ncbi:hypothetical protein LT336_00007 [Spiroplasma sp. JKS002671]|uniref:hypothetical protein n=1 Tax=Spiroplasma attinicola TaxID=2904537 RepID=UPI002022AF71|nr:hypothetical protein [Spiroplasma sp. JKS002671]MCL8210281.1 hypothetical protein [Spiroplasma sp. JKS002671]
MCQNNFKFKVKFNPWFFASFIFFIFNLILVVFRIIIEAIPALERNINGSIFDFSVGSLLTISTLIFGFYWANYQIRKDIRISKIEHYIQDFTKSHKLIKDILEKIEYLKFESISEIRLIVNTFDEYFGLHYFDIFIGNSTLPSIYISKQISNSMVYINKRMKAIEKFFSNFKYKFKIREEELITIIDIYIKNMNKDKKQAEIKFGESIMSLLKDKILDSFAIFRTIELLQNIDDLLTKDYIDKVLDKLKSIYKSLKQKAIILQKAIKKCEIHNKNDSNFCNSSQYLIINECINQSW